MSGNRDVKKAEKSLIQWEPIRERLIARFQTRFVKVTIIQCYAPTNDHNDEDKDKFYNQLQSSINKTPSHDLLLLMGDFNAKIGNDNISVERTIGTHGIGLLNQNGERLFELCQVSDLCISNTTLQHKDIHKVNRTPQMIELKIKLTTYVSTINIDHSSKM